MTTTSVFQGIQDGSKLSSRVLKPPGGGSSISFMDDDIPLKSSSQSSLHPLTPESPSEILEKASPLPENESTPLTPASEMKNGMHIEEKLHSSENSPLLKENIPPVLSEKDFENKLNVSLNGCKTNKEFDTLSETQTLLPISDGKSDTKPKSVNGVSGGAHEKESKFVRGNSVFEKIDSSHSIHTNITSCLDQNGSRSPTSLSPTSLSPTSLSPTSSLVVSPSMKPNQDTQERVIGHSNGALTPQSSQQTRKIKDHMRSSIIMSDEDYTPTRSSRFNATVKDTPPQNLPTAGQRQRIPPGGFSSKLW